MHACMHANILQGPMHAAQYFVVKKNCVYLNIIVGVSINSYTHHGRYRGYLKCMSPDLEYHSLTG